MNQWPERLGGAIVAVSVAVLAWLAAPPDSAPAPAASRLTLQQARALGMPIGGCRLVSDPSQCKPWSKVAMGECDPGWSYSDIACPTPTPTPAPTATAAPTATPSPYRMRQGVLRLRETGPYYHQAVGGVRVEGGILVEGQRGICCPSPPQVTGIEGGENLFSFFYGPTTAVDYSPPAHLDWRESDVHEFGMGSRVRREDGVYILVGDWTTWASWVAQTDQAHTGNRVRGWWAQSLSPFGLAPIVNREWWPPLDQTCQPRNSCGPTAPGPMARMVVRQPDGWYGYAADAVGSLAATSGVVRYRLNLNAMILSEGQVVSFRWPAPPAGVAAASLSARQEGSRFVLERPRARGFGAAAQGVAGEPSPVLTDVGMGTDGRLYGLMSSRRECWYFFCNVIDLWVSDTQPLGLSWRPAGRTWTAPPGFNIFDGGFVREPDTTVDPTALMILATIAPAATAADPTTGDWRIWWSADEGAVLPCSWGAEPLPPPTATPTPTPTPTPEPAWTYVWATCPPVPFPGIRCPEMRITGQCARLVACAVEVGTDRHEYGAGETFELRVAGDAYAVLSRAASGRAEVQTPGGWVGIEPLNRVPAGR